MAYVTETYLVYYKGKKIGYYFNHDDGTVMYRSYETPCEYEEPLHTLGLDKTYVDITEIPFFTALLSEEHRVKGKRQLIWQDGDVTARRKPKETDEAFSVYRRSAHEGDPDYSPLPHDAPHYEGAKTPEGMREWASWYQFRKMDDGTFQAELDEAWWWGGGHNDGGTIRVEIPEEWMKLPYEEFLGQVVMLAAAAHYGFTAEMLLQKKGLREFFGFSADT